MADRLEDNVPLEEQELRLRITKLEEDIVYVRMQRRLYPIVVTTGVAAAAVAFTKLFLT